MVVRREQRGVKVRRSESWRIGVGLSTKDEEVIQVVTGGRV